MFGSGGTARIIITFMQTGALYLGAAWLSVIAASLVAEPSSGRASCGDGPRRR
jgi:hypothetical protein